MSLPQVIARINRMGLNRVTRRFAGEIPPFALVHHVGRTSGTAYATPIWVFRRGEGFVICLTYGPRTDWLRNLEAAGSAELAYGGRRWRLSEGRVTHGSAFDQPLPKLIQIQLAVMRVKDFLHIRAVEMEGGEP